VRQAARAHTAAALEVLARALRSRQERVRLLAADLVLTRAYGRPGPEVDTEARALELRRAEAEARLVEARVREVEELARRVEALEVEVRQGASPGRSIEASRALLGIGRGSGEVDK